MLADGGFQVGELAKLMYPDGVDVKTKDVAAAITETSELLKRDAVTIFEPAIVHEGFLVRVDVLIKRGNVFEVIEVKAKSYSGDASEMVGARGGIKSNHLPYLQDVAFQKYVVQNAFPGSTVTAHLLMPDKSKTALSPEVISDTLGAILKYQDDIQKIQGSEAKRLLDETRKALTPA